MVRLAVASIVDTHRRVGPGLPIDCRNQRDPAESVQNWNVAEPNGSRSNGSINSTSVGMPLWSISTIDAGPYA